MNYFNYFTEIEEEFVRRRGSHLLVSPLDWSLIETWQQRGIPLHVVLRGINSSFESCDPKARRGRKVNSLFYCQQEVEAGFYEYLESRVGGQHSTDETNGAEQASGNGAISTISDSGAPFSRESIIQYLTDQREQLARMMTIHEADAPLSETFSRAARRISEIIADLKAASVVLHERIESDLTLVEDLLLEGLKQSAGAAKLDELRREGDQQLRAYRKGMEAEVYEQTRNNYIARRLREQYRVPRLSLFYL
ncbi:MAG: hypothetical protein U0Z53_17510 [Blastocatellia bacterium]